MKKILASILVLFCCLFCLLAPPAWAYVSPATGTALPGRVLRAYDAPEHNWLPGHRGVDLELHPGDSVLAADAGVVAFSGSVAGTPVVSIDHPDGIRTTYQPVHGAVKAGDVVVAGQHIGILGYSTGHIGLHWGARTGKDRYTNPLGLLPAPVIRLKPL